MSFTKSDRRVVMLLSMIAVACVCVMLLHDALVGEEGEKERAAVDAATFGDSILAKRADLPMFDPNTVDSMTLVKYGLGAVQIRSLLGYRRHGGTFEKPLALSKLYNWADADLQKVLPYVEIGEEYQKTYHYREQYEAEQEAEWKERQRRFEERKREYMEASASAQNSNSEKAQRYDVSNKFKSETKVDLNTADTTLLCRVPGVGRGIANSIVRLREKLGGFYKVEQLDTIKYISPELYKWFEVKDLSGLHLININKASFQTLNSHPYISYNQARDLMSYRRLYGAIKDREGLISIGVFTKEEVERLEPYLEY